MRDIADEVELQEVAEWLQASDLEARAREAKQELRKQGLVLLVGTWPEERDLAAAMEFDISGGAWVAVHEETFAEYGFVIPPMR